MTKHQLHITDVRFYEKDDKWVAECKVNGRRIGQACSFEGGTDQLRLSLELACQYLESKGPDAPLGDGIDTRGYEPDTSSIRPEFLVPFVKL